MRLAFLLLALLNGRLLAQTTVIRAGRVIDPASGTVATNQYVVVENRRIVAVGPAVPVLKDAYGGSLGFYRIAWIVRRPRPFGHRWSGA